MPNRILANVYRSIFIIASVLLLAITAAAQDPYPDAPQSFYRVGMLKWNDTPLDDAPDGVMKRTGNRQEFNLFPELEGAKFFARLRYRGKDRTIYELKKQDLMKTPEGREFLERVQRSIDQNRAEIEKLKQQGKPEEAAKLKAQINELAIYLTSEESFKETVTNNARAILSIDLAQPQEYSEDIIDIPYTPDKSEPPPRETLPREVAPGPVEPELEIVIKSFLKTLDLKKLAADRDAGKFDIFKDPSFSAIAKKAGSSEELVKAMKKVCSRQEFAPHSSLLADVRWKMLVDIFAQIAAERGIKIELIDSGKRNAYRSDVDLTVYLPPDDRGDNTIESVLKDAEARLKELTGGLEASSFDITMHNGDLFAPNIRNGEQSVAEHNAQLRSVVGELRLKVTSGGDASYFPGAQLEDAQKRGMRDGTVTELAPELEVVSRNADGTPQETRFKKPAPKERQIVEIGANGEIISNSARFSGEPLPYDRSTGLSEVAQNLEKLFRNGDKPGDMAKLFNRGLNMGAGSNEVNKFIDIHVSNLPDGYDIPVADAINIALTMEDPSTAPEVRKQLRTKAQTKAVAKMRWIIRSFRFHPTAETREAVSKRVLSLYELLNVTTAIEKEKGKGNFDWNEARTRHLKNYFERLKKVMPDLADTPAGLEKLYDEAYREFCDDLVSTLEEVMVKLEVEALRDLNPDRIERFRQKGGGPAEGEGKRLEEIAQKLAEQRRVELALILDVINRYIGKSLNDPTYKDVIKNQVERLVSLREKVLKAVDEVDPDAATDAQKLSEIFAAMTEESLAALKSPETRPKNTEEAIQSKEKAARQLAEVGPEQADKTINDETFREYIKTELKKIYNPADGPLLQQMFDGLESGLGGSITDFNGDPTTGEVTQGKVLTETLKSNLTSPLMVGSSVVTMTRAYVNGGDRALKEAAVGEAFNFLPPAYGVIGIAFKDFARGNVAEGAKSLGWLAGIHFAENFVPGVGQALLVYNIVTGVPEIVYTYTTERINSDMVEQAIRSQRVQGKRAARNPFKDSSDLFAGDTPEFPIFWDNPCMEGGDDGLTVEQRIPLISALYEGAVADELKYFGLKPEERRAIERQGRPDENPNLKPHSPQWYQERYRLIRKYAFDHPFYQRFGKIYQCFYPQVKAAKDKGFDEDIVLKNIFGKEVEKWFSRQPDGYKLEFDKLTDFGSGATRKRLLDSITAEVIALYHKNEYETFRKINAEQAAAAQKERVRQTVTALKQLLMTQNIVGDRLQKKLENRILTSLKQPQNGPAIAAQVQVKAPTWYVNVTGLVGPTYKDPKSQAKETTNTVLPSVTDDNGNIPVDVFVKADRSNYTDPDSLKHDFHMVLAGPIQRGRPAGFTPNSDESKLLAEVGQDDQPKNEVLTINLTASATVYDGQGKVLGQSKAPIVGYVISEVPHFVGYINILPSAPVPDKSGKPSDANVDYEIRLGNEVQRSHTPLPALFGNLKPGTYQVTVTPKSPDFAPASASFTLVDPYSKAALDSGKKVNNPESVQIKLQYTDHTASNNQGATGGQVGQTKPPGPKLPGKPGTGRQGGDDGSGGSGGDNQKAVSNCNGLAAQAQQFAARGDFASALNALQQANQASCGGIDPAVDQGLAGAQGAIDNGIKKEVTQSQQKAAQCEFEDALTLALQASKAGAGNPAIAGLNIGQLQAQADAQHAARIFLQNGQNAIRQNFINDAITALQSALAVPNLPACMRASITSLLGELNGRKLFGTLEPQVENALGKCDTKEAIRLVGLISSIRPQPDIVQTWLNDYLPKITEIQNKEREAADHLALARKFLRTDLGTFEGDTRVQIQIRIAQQAIAPCELKLDADLEAHNPDKVTDDVPGGLDPGTDKKDKPTDNIPGALDPGNNKKQNPNGPGKGDPGNSRNNPAKNGSTDGKTGSSQSPGPHWTLKSVTVSPETPSKGENSEWTYSKQSSSAAFTLYGNQRASYQWTPPPQNVDSNGFSISISLQSPKFEGAINVSASGLQGDPINKEVGPVHAPSSQTLKTTFKPTAGTEEFRVQISLGYGAVTYVYKYERAK